MALSSWLTRRQFRQARKVNIKELAYICVSPEYGLLELFGIVSLGI
jgi:hypothetical protein